MDREQMRMKLWYETYCAPLIGDRKENADAAVAAFDAKFPEPARVPCAPPPPSSYMAIG